MASQGYVPRNVDTSHVPRNVAGQPFLVLRSVRQGGGGRGRAVDSLKCICSYSDSFAKMPLQADWSPSEVVSAKKAGILFDPFPSLVTIRPFFFGFGLAAQNEQKRLATLSALLVSIPHY